MIVELTEEELEVVSKALGKFPYEQVHTLIDKFEAAVTEKEYLAQFGCIGPPVPDD